MVFRHKWRLDNELGMGGIAYVAVARPAAGSAAFEDGGRFFGTCLGKLRPGPGQNRRQGGSLLLEQRSDSCWERGRDEGTSLTVWTVTVQESIDDLHQ